MNDASAQTLEDLIKQHPFLKELDDPLPRLLPRLALPRTFSRESYEEVLRRGAPLEFDALIKRTEVQPVPDREGQYWLCESAQRTGREGWTSQFQEEREALARSLLANAPAGPFLDRASLLVFAEPLNARREFEEAYRDKDKAHDFAGCFTISEAASALLPYVTDEALKTTLREIGARYSARALFQREWHRTAAYYPRHEARREFEKVLEGKGGKWILQLYAAGGMGKTMFIEAQIARNLVIDPDRALVARLDLDFLAVNNIAHVPWLIALEIGRQMDAQLAAQPCREFLSSIRHYEPLLYSPQSDRYRAQSPEEARDLLARARKEPRNWDRLVSILKSLNPKQKIVIVLDTVEEASLYFPAELRRLLGLVEMLRAQVPQVRLVLSGRYHLGKEHLPQLYDKALRDATRECELKRFEWADATSFARSRLPGAPTDLIHAIARSANCFPFKLAMLVELVLDDPTLDATTLEKYEDADVAYLIQRVVKRIPSLPLRWLVRYGSVPQRLTRGFVREVMYPHLVRALAGEAKESGTDDPQQDVWSPAPGPMPSADELWNELKEYASDRGWINIDPHDADLASFHADIVLPTRKLLRAQKVYRQLHREATAWAETQAIQHPERSTEWKLTALYHRGHSGEDTDRLVREVLLSIADPTTRLQKAQEILNNRDFESVGRDPVRLIAADAFAGVRGWRYRLTGSEWSFVRSFLVPVSEPPPFWNEWRLLDQMTPVDLAAQLDKSLRSPRLPDGDRVRAMLLLEELTTDMKTRLELLEPALELSKRASERDPSMPPPEAVQVRLAVLHRDRGKLQDAAYCANAAMDRSKVPAQRTELVRLLTDIHLEMLRVERLERQLMAMAKDADAKESQRQHARLHLAIENPWGAERLFAEGQEDPDSLLIGATICSQLYQVYEALELYSRAEQIAQTPAQREAAIVGRARLLVKETGIESESYLKELVGEGPELQLLRGQAATLSARGIRQWVRCNGLDRIQEIEPASARLALLDWPVLDRVTLPADADTLFLAQPEGAAEAYLYNLRYADVLRVMGRFEQARSVLSQVLVPANLTLPNLWPLMAFRRRRQIEDRMAERDPSASVEVDLPNVWNPFRPWPLLYQACLMELGSRAMRAHRYEVVRECLDLAAGVEHSQTRYGRMYGELRIAVEQATPISAGSVVAHSLDVTVLSRQVGRIARWCSLDGERELISVGEDPALEAVVHPRLRSQLIRQLGEETGAVIEQFSRLVTTSWLVVTDPYLAQIPWELSARPSCRFVPRNASLRSELRWVQFDPASLERAFAEGSQSTGIQAPPWFVYVTPRRDQVSETYRFLHGEVSGLGLRTQIVNPWYEDGSLPLPSDGMSVLYLAVGIEERQDVPVLAGIQMDSPSLARRLASQGDGSRRPVVILDPPRPHSESERINCILLRNRFAQQLVETGTVEAVLATGLRADETRQSVTHQILLGGLHDRRSLAEVRREMWASGDDLATRATAAFVCNPMTSILP